MKEEKRTCVDCGNEFIDTVKDQEFRKINGWDTPPKRCRNCRKIKKQQKEGGSNLYGRATKDNR